MFGHGWYLTTEWHVKLFAWHNITIAGHVRGLLASDFSMGLFVDVLIYRNYVYIFLGRYSHLKRNNLPHCSENFWIFTKKELLHSHSSQLECLLYRGYHRTFTSTCGNNLDTYSGQGSNPELPAQTAHPLTTTTLGH